MAAGRDAAGHEHAFKLWPPSESTRSNLVERMSTNLCTFSLGTDRYVALSPDEALEHAKRIENEAFAFAEQEAAAQIGSSDTAVVQLYAKRASSLMLEAVKSKPVVGKDGEVAKSGGVGGLEGQCNGVVVQVDRGTETEFLSNGQAQVQAKAVVRRVGFAEEVSGGGGPTFFNAAGSGGKRAFVKGDQALEVLKPLTEPGNRYSSICFSNLSFDRAAGEVAAKVLGAIKGQLVDVNLADIVAGQSEADALAVMGMFSDALVGSELRSLNVSDNALGEKGVRAFGSLLKSQKALQEIYFMNNGISEHAARAICELIPVYEKLRKVHFHNNMTGDEGGLILAELVSGASRLEDFKFSSTRLSIEGGIALVEALQSGRSLLKLDLRDNMFGPEGGLALSKTLRSHAELREAYLSELALEDEGVIAITEALASTAPNLAVLELSSNEITHKSANSLASCISSKRHLIRLNLAENELKDKGAVIICKALLNGSENFKELDLSTNSLQRAGAVAAAQAVANKQHFKSLNLDGNQISEAGIEALRDELAKGVSGVSVLGSLDENEEEEAENDEDAEGIDADESEDNTEDGVLESQMSGLGVN